MYKIGITGLSGVIGQILVEELPSDLQLIDLYHEKKYIGKRKKIKSSKFDLLNTSNVDKVLEKIRPDIIIHLAAITHIDKCEKDKENGKDGIVWKTNVLGTEQIVRYCIKYKKKIIYMSTECVFDGEKEFFIEKDKKNPINWYGYTKSEAENTVIKSKINYAIIRAVVAYHRNDQGKTIYGKLLKSIKSENSVPVVYDQKFTPTFTYDIISAINIILDKDLKGIFHVAPNENISPYDMARIIAQKNDISLKKIKKVKLKNFYSSEAASLRLKNASLNALATNKKLGIKPLTPREAL